MGLNESLLIYLVIGLAVAVAVFLSDARRGARRTAFLLFSATFFWPLYLPLILSARGAPAAPPAEREPARGDEMALAIAQVELELDGALSSLDGWAEDALACEAARIGELRHALAAQAARIRDMDSLLDRAQFPDLEPRPTSANALPVGEATERWRKSQQARAHNITRLAQVRRQAHADLMATLAWIRELVSMIHLAKFTGAPASRAEELVAQIAAAVEGVSAVAWSESEITPRGGEASDAPSPTGAAASSGDNHPRQSTTLTTLYSLGGTTR